MGCLDAGPPQDCGTRLSVYDAAGPRWLPIGERNWTVGIGGWAMTVRFEAVLVNFGEAMIDFEAPQPRRLPTTMARDAASCSSELRFVFGKGGWHAA